MKKLLLKMDIVEAMSTDFPKKVLAGKMIVNTSNRPTIQPIDTNTITNTVGETIATKGSCPSCMTCPIK